MEDKEIARTCVWPGTDPLLIEYHDREWGVPVYDDHKQFEFLTLEAFQAGLSWLTVLKKRENFREAFAGFDPERVATFGEKHIKALLDNKGIIRNEAKIRAAVHNAAKFLEIAGEFGSFSDYLWGWVGGQPVRNHFEQHEAIPATTPLSDKVSKDLKQRGFKFMGSTVVYAHMQAAGLVNDHLVSCFRHKEVANGAPA